MPVVKYIVLAGSALIGIVGAPVHGKTIESLPALEQQLALFLGKQKGEVGGPRSNIDPRLRLTKCTQPPVFEMRSENLVIISCKPLNWRIPIALVRPVAGRQVSSRGQMIVKRGQPVLLIIEKNGFMISRQMQADRNGGIGDIIPVRAARRSSPILVEITGQGRVSLPSYQAD